MKVILQHPGELVSLLTAAGFPPDLRCGGRGTCGRCLVTLLAGRYRLPGGEEFEVTSPLEVKACRTHLLGDSGEVEIPDPGAIAAAVSWQTKPLPEREECVIAVDLGTTTVAAVKVRNGDVVAAAGGANLQARFGDNVVTRIGGGVEELRLAAAESINLLLDQIGADGAVRIAVAGNTVMSLLFHGIDPAPVGVFPFEPPCRSFQMKTAAELGLRAPAEIPILTVPAISGYVGGDIVAGLGEIELGRGELLLDLGTNCEMVFHTRKGLFSTAAAAGPAFEGAGIGCGRRAAPGVIDHIWSDGSFSALSDALPVGLCGTAMIDFLAVLRAQGRLNEFGRLVPRADFFEIAPGIRMTEGDIEQLLKAKAAVGAGLRVLVEHCGEPLRKIHLAGGFARYLNLESARRIGMLPPDCACSVIGNSSLAGAARLAVDPERLAVLERISALPEAVSLNELPGFEDAYVDGLLLP